MKTAKGWRLFLLISVSILVGISAYLLTSPNGYRLGRSNKPFNVPTPTIDSPTPSPVTKIPPTRIRIEKLNKSLPVTAALVHNNEWDLFDDKVSWLSTSAVPGEGSNVILYAHNTPRMFGDLYKLKVGDLIEIQQDQKWSRYVVRESRKINPTDIEEVVLEGNQLTLYTCEGSFNQKRRVVYATPLFFTP